MHDIKDRKLICLLLKSKIFAGNANGNVNELFSSVDVRAVRAEIEQLADELYQKFLDKYPENVSDFMALPSNREEADFQPVNLKNVAVDRPTSLGAENLCLQTMEKLELKNQPGKLGFNKKMANRALMAIIARAIFVSSEHKTAKVLEQYSELKNLLNYSDTITHQQLYAIADKLYDHKSTIEPFLYNKIKTMFDLKDKILIFDISNTYFETSKRGSNLAVHGGNSKEKRNDCPI